MSFENLYKKTQFFDIVVYILAYLKRNFDLNNLFTSVVCSK